MVILLVLASLACNLVQEEDDNTGGSSVNVGAPQVSIIAPAANAQVAVRQPLTVQVRATDPQGSGITRVELLVNNVPNPIDQKPSQNPAGDQQMDVNLSWTPQVTGNYTLFVRAYRGNVSSTPASLPIVVQSNIQVTATISLGSTPGGFVPVAPTFNPVCRARVDSGGLRLRSEPNTNTSANIITNFQLGDEPPVIGRLADSTWYQVQDVRSANRGWVNAAYVTLLGNCNTTPVINAPATPQPTLTPTTQSQQAAPADIVALPISGLTLVQLQENGLRTEIYIITIQNIGGRETGAFKVQIVLPGGGERIHDVTNLASGASIRIPANEGLAVDFISAGLQRIYVKADYQNVVQESNEGNNETFLDVNVEASPAAQPPPPENQ